MDEVFRVEDLTVRYGTVVACSNVSFAAPRGARYALLGRTGAGKSSLLRCLLGLQKPDSGRALLFGEDAWKKRRRLARRVASSSRDLGGDRELVILDEPAESAFALAQSLSTVLLATDDPNPIERSLTHAGILKRGRLIIEGPIDQWLSGLRRIRYVNRMTETRTTFGTELDEFHALAVRVRGWGIEAIVSGFEDEAFARFRTMDGVEEAAADSLTLAEAFAALG